MKAVLLNGTNHAAARRAGRTPTPAGAATGSTATSGSRTRWPNGDDSRRLRLFERTNARGPRRPARRNEYTIANVAPGIELRATLTWFDPDAAPGAASTLINNLDLEVVDPGGHGLPRQHSQRRRIDARRHGRRQGHRRAGALHHAGRRQLHVPRQGHRRAGRRQPTASDRQGYALAVSGAFAHARSGAVPGADRAQRRQQRHSRRLDRLHRRGRRAGLPALSRRRHLRERGGGRFPPGRQRRDARRSSTTARRAASATRTRCAACRTTSKATCPACVDVVSRRRLHAAAGLRHAHRSPADGIQRDCSVDLTWAAAQASCPTAAGVTYTVVARLPIRTSAIRRRSPANLATPGFTDADVINGTPYYYQVIGARQPRQRGAAVARRQRDAGRRGRPRSRRRSSTTSTRTPTCRWKRRGRSPTPRPADGVFSYHNAGDDQNYPDATCASITTPPADAARRRDDLSFKARYDLEFQWDGVVQEISTDGGANWNDLPPDGGYPSYVRADRQSAGQRLRLPGDARRVQRRQHHGVECRSGQRHDAVAVFKPFATDLAAYAGQSVQIRWRFSSDPAGELPRLLARRGARSAMAAAATDDVDVVFANGFDGNGGGDYGLSVPLTAPEAGKL